MSAEQRGLRMTAVRYLLENDGTPTGERKTGISDSGWTDLAEFQRDRMAHFKTHQTARADLTPRGINIIDREPYMGLREIIEVTLC